ncbi:hypothetical protein KA005_26185 [bacterium]|nr:hypothetical protein [bacterium]
MKEPINGVSQEYNDNTNNPETEICFQCHIYKKVTEFGKSNSKYVCNACQDEFNEMVEGTAITFIEVPGRKVRTMVGDQRTITDVYGIINDVRHHLGGYEYPASEFDVARARSDILSRQKEFVRSGGDFIKFYCHTHKDTPEQFINWIKEIGDNFGEGYDVKLSRSGEYWQFSGNLKRLSCAFNFRIFTEKRFDAIAEKLSDPYFKNIKVIKKGTTDDRQN